ncbi:hypothetical protein ACU4HD_46315 [Cupriavidus basilensis]
MPGAAGRAFHYACLGVSTYANTEALLARARQLGVRWMHDDEMDVMQLAHVLKVVEVFSSQVDHAHSDDVPSTCCRPRWRPAEAHRRHAAPGWT